MKIRGLYRTRGQANACLHYRSAGFTLIELMVTVAVMAAGLLIAVPGLSGIVASNRLTGAANQLVAAISQARLQAIKRNNSAQFCSDTTANNNTDALGAACNGLGAVWWMNVSTATQALGPVTLASNVTVSGATALRFAGNGLATSATATSTYTGLVADVYSSQLSQSNHRCIYLITGSVVSSCTVTGASGACPANEPASCQQ